MSKATLIHYDGQEGAMSLCKRHARLRCPRGSARAAEFWHMTFAYAGSVECRDCADEALAAEADRKLGDRRSVGGGQGQAKEAF